MFDMGHADMVNLWELVKTSEPVGSHIKVGSKTFILPDNSSKEFEVVFSDDCLNIIAITDTNMVILERKFRPGPEVVQYAMPGCLVDGDVIASAKKELMQDTGYEGNCEVVVSFPEDAYSTRIRYVVVATQCRKIADAHPTDFAEPVLLSLKEFRDVVRKGCISSCAEAYLALDHLNLL